MSNIEKIAKDLSAFDDESDRYVTDWTDEDREVSEAEFQAFSEQPNYSLRLAANIAYGESCGFAKSGREAYVVNKLNNAAVRATVRVNWNAGINNGQYDTVKVIPAGSRVYLGCTRGEGTGGGNYSYSVVGTVIL